MVLLKKSILNAEKNYGKFFWHYSIQFIFTISGMEATKIKGGESSSQFQWFTIAKIEL